IQTVAITQFLNARTGDSLCIQLNKRSDLPERSAGLRNQHSENLPDMRQRRIGMQSTLYSATLGFLVQANGFIKQQLCAAGLDQQRRQALQIGKDRRSLRRSRRSAVQILLGK